MISPRGYVIRVAILVAVIFAALFAFQCYKNRNADKKITEDITRSKVVEQQHAAQTTTSARVDTLVDTIYVREKALVESADRLRHTADTARPAGLRSVSSIADSSAMWHLRFNILGIAYDTLARAKQLADLRADSLAADRSRWHVIADSAVAVMVDLRADTERRCHILPFVPCMSAKAAILTGFGLGAATAVYVERRRRKDPIISPLTHPIINIRFVVP